MLQLISQMSARWIRGLFPGTPAIHVHFSLFFFKTGEPRAALLLHFTTGAHFLLSKASSAGRFLPHPAGASPFSTERRSRRMGPGPEETHPFPRWLHTSAPTGSQGAQSSAGTKVGNSQCRLAVLTGHIGSGRRQAPPQCCPRTCSCFPGHQQHDSCVSVPFPPEQINVPLRTNLNLVHSLIMSQLFQPTSTLPRHRAGVRVNP